MRWNPWSSVSEGQASLGSAVSAVAIGNGRFALFVVDPNGGVFTNSGKPDHWTGWSSVSEGRAAPGSSVSAIPIGGEQVALFLADPNGGIYTASGRAESGWSAWSSVSEGRAALGASVTAEPIAAGRFALFLADPNGGVYTASGNAQAGWGPWSSVSQGHSHPLSSVTVVRTGGGRFAVFVADPNGGIYSASGNAEAGWTPWSSVSEGRAHPGSSVAAVPIGGGRIALFVVDPNGGVYTASGNPQAGWSPWTSVSEGRAHPGSSVTAVALPENRIALFLGDPAGGVYTARGSDGTWGPWSSVSEGRSAPRSRVIAVPVGGEDVAVFVVDPAGVVYATSSVTNAQRSVADDIQTVPVSRNMAAPPMECRAPIVYTDPELQELGGASDGDTANGRLVSSKLRDAARAADPIAALALAATHFAADNPKFGRAFADLSVTGRRAFAEFHKLHRNGQLKEEVIAARARTEPAGRGRSDAEVVGGAQSALKRAYEVAQVMRGSNTGEQRRTLGFIAVSSEEDLPHRPVNVPATAREQFEVSVRVDSHTVHTRFTVAENRPDPAPQRLGPRELPREPRPTRLPPDSKVIVYVHGMGSRLEEADDLTAALHRLYPADNWTVIAMDLPSNGYADQLDHQQISPITTAGHAKFMGYHYDRQSRTELLDFVENFIVAFITTIDRELGVTDKVHAVVGGSLGGNMAFRLGRRRGVPWLRNVVAWSPAAIWNSLAGRDDPVKNEALRTAWDRAGGNADEWDETEKARATFFHRAFDETRDVGPIRLLNPQPEFWWGSSFRCRDDFIRASRVDRYEHYSALYRRWHWRLGLEQLIYTHQSPTNQGSEAPPRFLDNRINMLLAAGDEDNYTGTQIYDATRDVARRMVTTPGRARFFVQTGHSIHNERPVALASEIVDFLTAE